MVVLVILVVLWLSGDGGGGGGGCGSGKERGTTDFLSSWWRRSFPSCRDYITRTC